MRQIDPKAAGITSRNSEWLRATGAAPRSRPAIVPSVPRLFLRHLDTSWDSASLVLVFRQSSRTHEVPLPQSEATPFLAITSDAKNSMFARSADHKESTLRRCPRTRLINAILGRPEPIIVLDGSAGMGKSTLLTILSEKFGVPVHMGLRPPEPAQQGALELWDVPLRGEIVTLSEGHLRCEGHLVIAKRPGQSVPILDRAFAYERAAVFTDESLKLREEELRAELGATAARDLVERTGGWPALVAACFSGRETEAAAYCFREMFAGFGKGALTDIDLALADGSTSVLPPPGPFREIAQREARAEIQRRASEPETCRRLASAFARSGSIPNAVMALQKAGLEEEALSAFVRAGGWAFIFHFGPSAFDAALTGFSETLCRRSEPLVIALAFQALKRSDVPRAKRLI